MDNKIANTFYVKEIKGTLKTEGEVRESMVTDKIKIRAHFKEDNDSQTMTYAGKINEGNVLLEPSEHTLKNVT